MKNPEESLNRAKTGISIANYPAIFTGFMEKGIDEADILPRENIFTYNAWIALGRQVKKGEKGVKVISWIRIEKEGKVNMVAKTTTVFHISQTEEKI